MNWKILLGGGIAYFIITQILGAAFGAFVHNGVLEETYNQTAVFWRPELNEEPPNIAALMPLWIPLGLFAAVVFAGVYSLVRDSFTGSGMARGLKYGLAIFAIAISIMGGYFGIFNLPTQVWGWWAFETLAYYAIGGIVLGLVAEKLSPA